MRRSLCYIQLSESLHHLYEGSVTSSHVIVLSQQSTQRVEVQEAQSACSGSVPSAVTLTTAAQSFSSHSVFMIKVTEQTSQAYSLNLFKLVS